MLNHSNLKVPLSITELINNYMADFHKNVLKVPDIIRLYRCLL